MVNAAIITEKKKLIMFLQIANFLPRYIISKGNMANPTVVQAKRKAVTANKLTPSDKSSPPAT
jgi:hypothetical protein